MLCEAKEAEAAAAAADLSSPITFATKKDDTNLAEGCVPARKREVRQRDRTRNTYYHRHHQHRHHHHHHHHNNNTNHHNHNDHKRLKSSHVTHYVHDHQFDISRSTCNAASFLNMYKSRGWACDSESDALRVTCDV